MVFDHDHLMKHLSGKLHPWKSTTLEHRVKQHQVNDYVEAYNAVLRDTGEAQRFKIYRKKNFKSKAHDIKIKPVNKQYVKRVVKRAEWTFRNAMRYFGNKAAKNPKMMVWLKKTNDKSLAQWYKSVLDNVFVDNVVSIVKVMKDDLIERYHIVVHCTINLNIEIH